MGRRVAVANRRASRVSVQKRQTAAEIEDLSAFVAQLVSDAPLSDASIAPPAFAAPVPAGLLPSDQPRTRREARERLRASQPVAHAPRALGTAIPVTRPTDSDTPSSVATQPAMPRPRAGKPGGRANRRARASRGPAVIAGSAVLALVPSLMFSAPASAAEGLSPERLQATIDSNSKLIAQKLQVSAAVEGGTLEKENFVAGAIAGIVAAESGPNGGQVALALAAALRHGGVREKIVETALTYLGDPYVLGGASHGGIDCSGLTMVAYASVGVSLVHYVPAQDAVATTISGTNAQPGDLVFFNDDAHVALYLGGGMIMEAADYGIPARIVSLSTWSGMGYHFGRILPS